MSYTYGQMQTDFQNVIDKSGSDWFTPTEQDMWLNKAQDEYILSFDYTNFERDERMREELTPLVSPPTTFNNTLTINLSTLPTFQYVLSVSAVIPTQDVFGNSTGTVNVSVQPRPIDKFMKNLTNSFTQPTQNDPVYQQWTSLGVKTLTVYAGSYNGVASVPNTVTILYLNTPATINGTSSSGTAMVFSDDVCRKIIDLAARKALGVLENEKRVETQQLEISQSQPI